MQKRKKRVLNILLVFIMLSVEYCLLLWHVKGTNSTLQYQSAWPLVDPPIVVISDVKFICMGRSDCMLRLWKSLLQTYLRVLRPTFCSSLTCSPKNDTEGTRRCT